MMYEKIMDRCDKILTDKYAQLAEIETKLADKETERDGLLKKVETLKESGTFEEYERTKDDLSKVHFQIERLKEWRDNLTENKLITKGEYESLIQEATDEVSAQAEALKLEMINLAEEYYKKGSELKDLITSTNEAFYHLQSDIYRRADQPRTAGGFIIDTINRRILPSGLWTVANWATLLGENFAYAELTGHKIQQEGK